MSADRRSRYSIHNSIRKENKSYQNFHTETTEHETIFSLIIKRLNNNKVQFA